MPLLSDGLKPLSVNRLKENEAGNPVLVAHFVTKSNTWGAGNVLRNVTRGFPQHCLSFQAWLTRFFRKKQAFVAGSTYLVVRKAFFALRRAISDMVLHWATDLRLSNFCL